MELLISSIKTPIENGNESPSIRMIPIIIENVAEMIQ